MFIAIVLGIVEGLTEFLPISSTGHLILAGHLLGFVGEKAATFEIFIQLGAICAVAGLYWRKFIALFDFKNELRKASGLNGTRGLAALFITTLPAAIVGLSLHGFIKIYLFSVETVALGLGVGGVALIVIESRRRQRDEIALDAITFGQAGRIGLFQVLALWPGVSRSGATIIGGMAQGLERGAAVEYSFLAAVPLMIAATVFDLWKSLPGLQRADLPVFATGFIVSFVTAIAAIKVFVRLIKTTDFKPFGWYRIVLAILIFSITRYAKLG